MGLGSSFLEKVVIPYANSPSTNPNAKVCLFLEIAKESDRNILGRDSAAPAGPACAIPRGGGLNQMRERHHGHSVAFVLFRCSDLTKASFRRPGHQKSTAAALRCRSHLICGGGGIRTPGTFRYNSFQDCRHRPLGHTSIWGYKVNKKICIFVAYA